MSILTTKLPNTPIVLTLLSVRVNGLWFFSVPNSKPTQKGSIKYYKINFDFGLCHTGSNNPSDVRVRGKKGDYVALNSYGVYAVIKKEMYKKLFPSLILSKQKAPPLSSKVLTEDPGYLTKIFKETESTDSNTVVITPVPTTLPTSTGTTY